MRTNQINPNTERFRMSPSDVSSDGVLGVLSAGQGGVTGKSTLAPLDLTALTVIAKAATQGPWYWRNTSGSVYLMGARTRVVMGFTRMGMQGAQPQFVDSSGVFIDAGKRNLNAIPDARHIAAFDPPIVLALIARAETAEAAVARVEAICKDTDGNWLDPEDECNNVGGILQSLRGEHTKQLGGTPTGEFADVCSCGKSYWPCDSLDGTA